jgi:hypothetical protein
MSLKVRPVLGWLAWGGAAFGVLQLGQLPGDVGESLCGPWG